MSQYKLEILSDAQLLEMIRQGDRAAFDQIFKRYWSKLYLSAYKMLRDKQSSEDIVQEVLVRLWVRRFSQQIESLNAYLYAAVRFQVFTTIRKGKARESLSMEVEELLLENSAESNLMMSDITKLLHAGMAELPEKCREIFSLSRMEQLSTKEIASKLGISPKTVENQLTIAFRKLKISMGDVLFCLSTIALTYLKK